MGEDSIFCFGDLLEYNGNVYVYLAGTPDIYYLAKILNLDDTKTICSKCENGVIKNKKNIPAIMYCFVVLKTDDFKDRAAFYGIPGEKYLNMSTRKLSSCLNSDDLSSLKKDILSSECVPKQLVELVKMVE